MITQWIIVFFAYVLLDIIWAEYTKAIASRKRLMASSWAAVIPVMSSILFIAFVSNPWLLSAAACGGFVGTWLSVSMED
jgi:nicotinamide riboside transporter PnuC